MRNWSKNCRHWIYISLKCLCPLWCELVLQPRAEAVPLRYSAPTWWHLHLIMHLLKFKNKTQMDVKSFLLYYIFSHQWSRASGSDFKQKTLKPSSLWWLITLFSLVPSSSYDSQRRYFCPGFLWCFCYVFCPVVVPSPPSPPPDSPTLSNTAIVKSKVTWADSWLLIGGAQRCSSGPEATHRKDVYFWWIVDSVAWFSF